MRDKIGEMEINITHDCSSLRDVRKYERNVHTDRYAAHSLGFSHFSGRNI